jgi:RNA polymerase sigma-70 factor, ECF subfamily
MARASRGDETAWAEIFDLYYVKLYGFFMASVGRAEVAEDLAVKTLLQAYRRVEYPEARHERLGAWLFRIASRLLTARIPHPVARRRNPDPPCYVRGEFIDREVRDVLARLRLEHRGALELRYVIGLSTDEAAAVSAYSPLAFAALLRHALASYRREARGLGITGPAAPRARRVARG